MVCVEEVKIGVVVGGEMMIDLNDVEEDLLIVFDVDCFVDVS